jgi:cellulose synthase/poly-beta-1,6-N-acetylglucosamine synthase-like glycosyltransferase
MLILLLFFWLATLLYVLLLLLYRRGWQLQKDFVVPEGFTPETKVTVIVPARNEAENIAACVQSVLTNDYPAALLEIIVIDDHSTDSTWEIVNAFPEDNVRCLKLADFLEKGTQLNSYKKKAIETAITHASGDLIITTDADCIVPVNWLRNMVALYQQNKPVMIVAPVAFTAERQLVQLFQSIDFMTMQGITAAAHRLKLGNMSNGANLAFSRKAFLEVEGYKGVDHLASGDDLLLMMKMQQHFPGRIEYLKSSQAIVTTTPQQTWKSFLQQRVRWASKSGKYDDKRLTSVLLLVYLFNLSFVVLFLLGFSNSLFWLLAVAILLIKTALELYFLLPVAAFFGKEKELLWFPFLQPVHIIYIVSAGFLGFFGKYEWKGRRVK